MTIIELRERDVSRRMLLRKTGLLAAAGAFLGVTGAASLVAAATAVPKKAQNTVAYQQTPKGSARCNACDQWQPPQGCKTVLGTINPTGWCNLYSPKW